MYKKKCSNVVKVTSLLIMQGSDKFKELICVSLKSPPSRFHSIIWQFKSNAGLLTAALHQQETWERRRPERPAATAEFAPSSSSAAKVSRRSAAPSFYPLSSLLLLLRLATAAIMSVFHVWLVVVPNCSLSMDTFIGSTHADVFGRLIFDALRMKACYICCIHVYMLTGYISHLSSFTRHYKTKLLLHCYWNGHLVVRDSACLSLKLNPYLNVKKAQIENKLNKSICPTHTEICGPCGDSVVEIGLKSFELNTGSHRHTENEKPKDTSVHYLQHEVQHDFPAAVEKLLALVKKKPTKKTVKDQWVFTYVNKQRFKTAILHLLCLLYSLCLKFKSLYIGRDKPWTGHQSTMRAI